VGAAIARRSAGRIASLGGEEFKLPEVVGNMVVLTILCVIVFKVGLQMNVSILRGVW